MRSEFLIITFFTCLINMFCMIYRYSCTTLNYIMSVVYKCKLSTDLWITIWTEKNTMLFNTV